MNKMFKTLVAKNMKKSWHTSFLREGYSKKHNSFQEFHLILILGNAKNQLPLSKVFCLADIFSEIQLLFKGLSKNFNIGFLVKF